MECNSEWRTDIVRCQPMSFYFFYARSCIYARAFYWQKKILTYKFQLYEKCETNLVGDVCGIAFES